MRNRSAKYWADAAAARESEAMYEAEQYTGQMRRLYDHALRDIDKELDKLKANYAKRFGIDEAAAERHLARAARNYSMESLAQQLLSAGTDEERRAILDFIHLDGLSTRAYGARRERYEAVKNNIALRLIRLEMTVREGMERVRKDAYRNNYYRVLDDTARGIDAGVSFSLIDEAALDEVMSRPWHGKRFSESIWTNTQKLADNVQEIVGRYIVSGRSLDEAGREVVNLELYKGQIADEIGRAAFHAETLVRTEVAHARSMSDIKAYEELGLEEYKYMATLDERTCDVCAPLDGKIFRMDERAEGRNYPVMHPRCRCTTTYPKDWLSRRARDPLTGRNTVIDGSINYRQWREGMSEEEAAAFEKAQRKYRNKAADKAQYEKYKTVLGKENVPKTFDKWQEMKYNRSEENVRRYEEIKGAYRYVNANPGADMNAYRCAKELRVQGIKGAVHIPRKDIDIKSLGFDNVHINRERNHNVSEKEAKQYIQEAVLSITKRGGISENYYSKKGISYVNPIEKTIKTAFSRDEFKGDALTIIEVIEKYGY